MDHDQDQRGAELERLRPYLHLVARMHLDYSLRSLIDPEDAVQDAFVKALQHWDECRGSRKAWLRGILLNDLKDKLDKEKAQKRDINRKVALDHSSLRIDSILIAEQSSPSERAARNEDLARLEEALLRLLFKQQEVIILHHLHQMKLREVAQKLGITLGATAGVLRNGLKAPVRYLTFPE